MNMLCEQARSKFLNTVLVIFDLEKKIVELFSSYTTSVIFSIVSKGAHLSVLYGLIFLSFSINLKLEFILNLLFKYGLS